MTFYQQPLSGESVSAVTATPSEQLGTYRKIGGTEYVYAYNAGNTPAMPGAPVYLNSNTSSYSFTITNAASIAGIYAGGVYHTTISTAYYGWIATRGVCRVRPDTGAISFNSAVWLHPGVDDGYSIVTATVATATPIAYSISSGVTHEGASLASCGLAWVNSKVW